MTGLVASPTLDTMPPPPPNPYDGYGPVHPGTEPIFPLAEADAAIEAIQTLLDELMAFSNTRDSAAGEMLGGSSGDSIQAFIARNDELSTQLSSSWNSQGSSLQLDAQWLRDAKTNAITLHDYWQTQLNWHVQWTAANPGVDPRTGPR